MTFANPSLAEICSMLRSVHTIAIVGLSPNTRRPSFRVASTMQSHGYRIVPVRPRYGGAQPAGAGVAASHLLPQRKGGSEANPPAYSLRVQSAGYASNVSKVRPLVQEALGGLCYDSLERIPFPVDMVNAFRAPQHVPAIVESCSSSGVPHLRLQEGVIHEEAAQRAGIKAVMNRCIWRDFAGPCAS